MIGIWRKNSACLAQCCVRLGLTLVTGVLMVLSVSWMISLAQSGTVVGLTSPEMYLAVGEEITVTVQITDVAGLYAAEFFLPFPSDLVTITDADPGTSGVQIMPGDCLELGLVFANEVDAGTDEIRYAITQLAPSQPFTGNCSLAYIHFTALDEGHVPLMFNEVQITTIQGPIPEPLDCETREITLTIDSTSPTSVVTVPAVSRFPPASLIWTAADAWSGIEAVSMWYRFEDGDWDLLSDQLGSTGLMEFSFPDGEGQYQFITQAVDGAGNVEEFTGHEVATTVYEPIRLHMPLISRR